MQATQIVPHNVALSRWVDQAKADPIKHQERQVTEILLHAIGITKSLKKALILKGGVLMSLMHGSYRQTGNIDFTAIVDPEPYSQILKETLNRALSRATPDLGYTDLLCAVQRFDYQPRKEGFAEMTAPALKVSIGYAKAGTREADRLREGKSSRILQVDISFKEKVINYEDVIIEEPDVSIQTYSFEEIIAEKFRAMLQQVSRNRIRRQDVFDIRWLIERYNPEAEVKARILDTLLQKSEDRDIDPKIGSLNEAEVKERSAKEWDSMKLEIGEKLPDFNESYGIVQTFYRSLPWT